MAFNDSSSSSDVPAIAGTNTAPTGIGVKGTGRQGVVGISPTFQGVFGQSEANAGVVGEATNFHAVFGISHDVNSGGIFGTNDSAAGFGVVGTVSNGSIAVVGDATGGGAIGVRGTGNQGVVGISHAAGQAGVFGTNDSAEGFGVLGTVSNGSVGVAGESTGGGSIGVRGKGQFRAALFEGDVEVTGDIFLQGADYAEALSTTDASVEAGLVVVLGHDGEVHPCAREYDTAVAGIVSGACDVKPAIVLDRHEDSAHVALMGKVWCRADADAAPIHPGDLLTTSSTPGHCRRVTELHRAFGAVIGKALTPLLSGTGFVRVLVSPR
jgi:hypothetical protein